MNMHRCSPRYRLIFGCSALGLFAAVAGWCDTRAATTTRAPATPAPAENHPPVQIPPPPPAAVPDEVNPFADEKNAPKPLQRPARAPTRLSMDVVSERFDGLTVLQMILRGPDFEWVFDPLSDWVVAPPSGDESLAFTYRFDPSARFALALWGPKDFMPGITTAAITEYLAAVRNADPKNFILLTPISRNSPSLEPTSFAGFNAQGVRYATVTPTTVLLHRDWFVNLNDEYLLVITLSGPTALMDKFNGQIPFFLSRSYVRKGLGIKDASSAPASEPKPAPAE